MCWKAARTPFAERESTYDREKQPHDTKRREADETVISNEPPETGYDLYFAIAGVPVRVHPFFWLVAVLFGLSARDLFGLLAWV
ncbi:MAG: hypothetical protein D6741_10215, partial [Planctomycetota bacterium]